MRPNLAGVFIGVAIAAMVNTLVITINHDALLPEPVTNPRYCKTADMPPGWTLQTNGRLWRYKTDSGYESIFPEHTREKAKKQAWLAYESKQDEKKWRDE